MHRLKNHGISKIFTELIKKPNTTFQQSSHKSAIPKSFPLNNMKYSISFQGPQ